MYHFDRTGRFVLFTEAGHAIRRGLDHRTVESRETGPMQFRQYRELTNEEKDDFLKGVYKVVKSARESAAGHEAGHETSHETSHEAGHETSDVATNVPTDEAANGVALAWIDRILSWQTRGLSKDASAFRQVYLPISILPPDQYKSLVVQLTEGCSYNRCLFCDFYRDRPFHIKSPSQLQKHLADIREFFGERLQDRTGIFLGDGNALVVPTDKLLAAMADIQAALPLATSGAQPDAANHSETGAADASLSGFSSFMDTFNLERKSLADLQAIRNAGLRTVYVGLETGSNRLREFLRKPGSVEEAVEAIARLKEASFQVGVIVLVGVGGSEFAKEHLQETVAAIARMPLGRGDLVYLSPFVEPNNQNYAQIATLDSLRPNPDISPVEEVRQWRRQLRAVTDPKVKIALYSILQHLY